MAYKYIWEDPRTFKINKEDGHTFSMPFDSIELAMSGEILLATRYGKPAERFSKSKLRRFEVGRNQSSVCLADGGIQRALLLCKHISESTQQS